MNPELLISLATFSLVSSITPGPNNLMLMASGANFGVLRSIPHLSGVAIGFVIMTLIVGAGLAQVFDRYPVSYNLLKVISIVYLLFLAWKIANAAPVKIGGLAEQSDQTQTTRGKGIPISFLQAVLFQWVNPKAWAMALTALSVYNPSRSLTGVVLVATVFGLINLPCVSSWLILGQQISRLLHNNQRLRLFNWTMALLLVLSLLPVLSL